MLTFMERLEKNCRDFPKRLALARDYRNEPVTYGELWDLSGKVYAYLKARDIGTEDFVLIHLPRGPKIPVAMIGIWRAGAACTVTEDDYPDERVAYIERDCKARLVINEEVYHEMLAGEALAGRETADPHDACYAVYTSGTTGNPKGALHEYGKMDVCVRSYPKLSDAPYGEGYCHAATYPLNFVVFFVWLIPQLYFGNSIYILSYEIVKNMGAFGKLISDEGISEFFMSPALLKLYQDIPDTLHLIYTGSDNVTDLYFENVTLKNGYGMSETACFVAAFTVDRPYRRTPVGKNVYGLEIKILDDEGQAVKNGEHGEVCFQNDYFRGYISLPEQTENVFRGNIFHTGDLGYLDGDGNLFIVGRKDDMIKIHGNRVEPTEVEIVLKDVLAVKNIIAKGFSDGDRAFLAVYGLTSEIGDGFDEKNLPALREKLSERLPQYMIPSYYIAMDKFPTNANGKVSRKLFSAPEIKHRSGGEYVPPVTETEKAICSKMAEVLGVEKVSRNADFYQMGGDSLKTIRLVNACEELPMKSGDVYRYHTPEKLAAFCDENKRAGRDEKTSSPLKAMEEEVFPEIRRAYQTYLTTGEIRSMYSSFFAMNEEAMTDISMNPATEIVLKEEVDPLRLQDAVNQAVELCPYVAFDISKRDGIVYFHRNNLPMTVQRAGTMEAFGSEENHRHYAAVAYEKNKIIFAVSHILTDGFGMNRWMQTVLEAYFGRKRISSQEAGSFDFVADLMAQDLPLPEGWQPEPDRQENHFVPPEAHSPDRGNGKESWMEISAQKFDEFCQGYQISGQIAVSLLLAEAIQKTHPDNTAAIRVRGPVNTRIPLFVPNTFQNASIPHIFLNFAPDSLDGGFSAAALDKVKQEFLDQYSYENLAAFTNRTREFFTTQDDGKRAAIVADYKTQTDIFANYMGKVLTDDIAEGIECFRPKLSPSYPLMLYALQYGEILVFHTIQSFSSSDYMDSLREILTARKMLAGY